MRGNGYLFFIVMSFNPLQSMQGSDLSIFSNSIEIITAPTAMLARDLYQPQPIAPSRLVLLQSESHRPRRGRSTRILKSHQLLYRQNWLHTHTLTLWRQSSAKAVTSLRLRFLPIGCLLFVSLSLTTQYIVCNLHVYTLDKASANIFSEPFL